MDKKDLFIKAIRENEGFIRKLASAHTNNAEDREDLIQEILYQLWKSFGTFTEKSKLSTWMYRVALNVSIYQLKKSGKKIPVQPIDENTGAVSEDSPPEPEERWIAFRKEIEKLNLLERGILMLYLDDKSYDEIAEITGLSNTNVGTKLQRIKARLKKQLTQNL